MIFLILRGKDEESRDETDDHGGDGRLSPCWPRARAWPGAPAKGSTSSSAAPAGGTSSSAAASCTNSASSQLYAKGTLTVATDNPAYPPWFATTTRATARAMRAPWPTRSQRSSASASPRSPGCTSRSTASYAPGPKAFDFDINEVSFTAQRAQAVTFSNSYYPVQQAIVALKGSPIVTKHSPAQLKTYLYGDQIGTTGLSSSTPHPADQAAEGLQHAGDVDAALKAKRIDAGGRHADGAVLVVIGGRGSVWPSSRPPGEHYGLVFAKGNPLVTCVNKALATLTSNGTLAAAEAVPGLHQSPHDQALTVQGFREPGMDRA